MATNDPIFDAFAAANERGAMPTHMNSQQLRELSAEVRARAVFSATATNAVFVNKIKEVADAMASGSLSPSDAKQALRETLRAIGYTPEGGFPDAEPGKVPPAVEGTIQDLSSNQRLDLIVETQLQLNQGAGNQARFNTPDRLEAAPALELIREMPREVPRNWQSRWAIAGGQLYGGRMIAFKGDPVWGELGSSGNFPDALDTDYPPFAFNSGMGVQEVSREDAIALGVVGPSGESIDEWFSGPDRPVTMAGELPLPSPSISLKDVDPAIVAEVRKQVGATGQGGQLDFSDILARELANRNAAVQAQRDADAARRAGS